MFGLLSQHKHSMIGLDIGSYSIKMIQFVRQGSDLAVSASGCYRFSEPLPESGRRRHEMLVEACSKLRQSAPFVGDRVVSALSSESVNYKNIRLPHMPPGELAEAAKWEAIDRLGVDENEAQIDFINAGEVHHGDEARDELIVFAVSNERIKQHMDTLIEAGLRPIAIETTPTALCRSMAQSARRQDDDQQVRVLVDVGAGFSDVLILRGSRVLFYKPIEIGGRALTEAVAKELNLSEQDAWEVRRKLVEGFVDADHDHKLFGSTRREDVQRAVKDATRPILTDLAREIGLCLRYYSVTFRGARPDKLTLVGGESRNTHLSQILGDELEIDTENASPLSGFDLEAFETSIERRGDQCEWAIAAGLALRELPSAVNRMRGAA